MYTLCASTSNRSHSPKYIYNNIFVSSECHLIKFRINQRKKNRTNINKRNCLFHSLITLSIFSFSFSLLLAAIIVKIALAALAGSQLRTANQSRNQPQTNRQQHEMTVPNDLIGCIIGKGGTKIAEIRQISGAMIRISNCEEREGGNTDRTITISGNPESVALAQYLINMR